MISIRTAYRIVESHERERTTDPIYYVQYQEEGNDRWRTFQANGRGVTNPVYFYTLSSAKAFLDKQRPMEDRIVHHEELM